MTSSLAKVVVILMTLAQALADCDSNFGPSGTVDCIPIPRYNNEPQWATCLTDAYIQSKSKGRHLCEDRTITYCYYQCMLEILSEEDGPVSPRCSCGNDESSTTTLCPPREIVLPDRCFSPDGTNCGWYRDCLEARFQCSSGADDYGITYAEKYCNLYDDKYQDFSSLGQRWISAVRKCLQVELVPLLRPFECPTCEDIKTRAFNSHSGCYVAPHKNAPSICSLPVQDFWKIFWTVKSAFTSEFVETVFGMLKVLNSCTVAAAQGVADFMTKLVIEVTLPTILEFSKSLRNKRSLAGEHDRPFLNRLTRDAEGSSADYSTAVGSMAKNSRTKRSTGNTTWRGESNASLHYHKIAAEVAKELAQQLGWGSLKIQWFAYGVYAEDANMLKVNVFLADQTLNASSPSAVNLTRVVQQAAESYQDGTIHFNVRGTALPAGRMLGCIDEECQQTFVNTTAPSVAVSLEGGWLMMVLSTSAAALLAERALFWG
ncbi:uncharacterized protein [Littorina saxatilis]|uniref:Uncharacterized protein n=2 Tax=Littorina saxatilis TaxID=31220 RepID=A0AAN9BLY6_9CAEN